MTKMYEIECQRRNVTPKAFFEYCRKQMAKKGIDIECWTEFESWSNPINPEKTRTYEHEDGQIEKITILSYDLQYYFKNAYNFILEFEFDTETKGCGYMYAMEFER